MTLTPEQLAECENLWNQAIAAAQSQDQTQLDMLLNELTQSQSDYFVDRLDEWLSTEKIKQLTPEALTALQQIDRRLDDLEILLKWEW